MANQYQQRAKVTPPHVSLRALRIACGRTLDQVCEQVEEATGQPLTRGALSAIESGLRGASAETLRGIAAAFGLTPEDIDTQYSPRGRVA